MGEYAIRKSDNQEIKIGTCESMYYIRYEDRGKVRKLPGSLDPTNCDGLFWRLPFPDEDEVRIGEYDKFNRGERLWKYQDNDKNKYTEDFSDPTTIENPGTMQFHNAFGLLLNVKCYHGEKLPEKSEDVTPFWNGKSWFWELAHIKNMNGELWPVVQCRACGRIFRYTWNEILPYIQDATLRARLEEYAKTQKSKAA